MELQAVFSNWKGFRIVVYSSSLWRIDFGEGVEGNQFLGLFRFESR